MRNAILIGILLASIFSFTNLAFAETMWFFEGICDESTVKQESPEKDFSKIEGRKLNCEFGVLIEIQNGRKLIQFTNAEYLFGFAGGDIDKVSNENFAMMPIDRIFLPRNIKIETPRPEDILDNAEGICFLSKELQKSKEISCVSKYEESNIKYVFNIHMIVRKVTRKSIGKSPN
jgi:hypothetical protein